MQERIHEQISHELKQATRLDTKIAVIAIVVTLILFTIAMIFAFSTTGSITGILGGIKATVFNVAPTIIMFVSLLAIAAVNWYSVRTLLQNKKQRAKLTKGLMKLYKDEGVAQYYDGSIFKSYETRYNLFAIILTSVAAVSVIAPVVIFIDRLINL
jgi:energy-coupling factor transporter transmembrane protein EcfT